VVVSRNLERETSLELFPQESLLQAVDQSVSIINIK